MWNFKDCQPNVQAKFLEEEQKRILGVAGTEKKPRKANLTHLEATEADEQRAFIAYLQAKGFPYCAIPNANAMSFIDRALAVKIMAKMKAQGLQKGFPDLVVFLPSCIAFIEMKRKKGGVASEEQKEWINIINGFPYSFGAICKGAKEARSFIDNLINIGV